MIIGANDLVTCEIRHADRAELERRARYEVPIQVRDRTAVVHFDEPRSAALFASRYRDMRANGEADIHAYAVRDASGNSHFWTDRAAGYTFPFGALGPAATAFLADAVALDALLKAIPSAIALHAAAFYRDARAFAITGHSTAGKSTTAVALVYAGCELYSDERCIITPDGTLPFPRTLNLRSGGIDLLIADLPPGPLRARLAAHRGTDWDDVHFAELFERRPLPPAVPLSAIFAIAGLAAEPRTRRIRPMEMLRAAQFGAVTAGAGIDRACAILSVLHGMACYELILGAPCASARHIVELIAKGDGA